MPVPSAAISWLGAKTLTLKVSSDVKKPRATNKVNGTAVIQINGEQACTATIKNGVGSCKTVMRWTGKLRFNATFEGIVAGSGTTITVEAKATAVATSASVAINRARLYARACVIKLNTGGLASRSGRTVRLLMLKNGRWVKIGKTKSRANRSWKFTGVKVKQPKVKLRATDGVSTTATFKAGFKNRTTFRGC